MIYEWHLECMANVQASTGGTLCGIPADPIADALESFVAELVPLHTSSSQVLESSLVWLTKAKMGFAVVAPYLSGCYILGL